MSQLREISEREWKMASECVAACHDGLMYFAPDIESLDEIITAVAGQVSRTRRTAGLHYQLPYWLEDLDRLIDRRMYLSMLPDEAMLADGGQEVVVDLEAT